jgi:hypothetical protein
MRTLQGGRGSRREEQDLRMGDPDQRGADDRPAHKAHHQC